MFWMHVKIELGFDYGRQNLKLESDSCKTRANHSIMLLQLKAVLSHKWMVSGETNGINIDGDKILSPFSADRLPVLSGEEEADPDVLLSMSSLGCFREREKLLSNLMSSE